MEPATAVVSFVGLAAPVAQGLKFLYDFTTNMQDCPKDIREMKTDLELVEDLILQVVRQCNERDRRLRDSQALARAIRHAQESVENLGKEMAAYGVDGKRKRFRFAVKVGQTQKLRASLDRTRMIMSELKNQLQSDLLYEIRDTGQKVLKSVEKTNRELEKHERGFPQDVAQIESQAKGRAENSVQQTSNATSDGLTDIEIIAKKLDNITELLAEPRISPQQASASSTPALSREVSEMSSVTLSQDTTVNSVSSSPSVPRSVTSKAPQPSIVSNHPLLQFKDKPFNFLVAIIFTQRTKRQSIACQCAAKCLAAYPTPESLSQASPEVLSTYFDGIGLQNVKPPQLIKLSKKYIDDPPIDGILRSKAKCPKSEISHLPHIGLQSINAWLVYCRERTDVETEEKPLLEYMRYLTTGT